MKKKLICMMILSLFLFGCSGQKELVNQEDYIVCQQDSPGLPNQEQIAYEFNIGNEVCQAMVRAELWQNGECRESFPVILNKGTKKLNISILYTTFDTGKQEVEVLLRTGTASGEVDAYYELPKNVVSYGFTAYANEEVIEIKPEEEKILGRWSLTWGMASEQLRVRV